ncbi:transcriptional repressor TraM [Chelatococcus asaccharovorans]|uniref:transcriptional repressor TraM n=2 Tax=Chelatococcus asaccharovorans TaxID=28210 RepID=UPI00224C783B|nr:transcriptional repressor TraM [Chelatococcus asaccharovorans]CAH1660860.1 hypothetical protein CHELA17_50008 [Chelatococcus asaccharovorans]CAH1690202.1 hypothetical protein CHELA40_40186 [Chelatococcus asaccharovorans]
MHGFLTPGLGSKDCRRRGRTADQLCLAVMSESDLSSESKCGEVLRDYLASVDKTMLERLVIDAIREHRCLLESDQLLHEEWQRAATSPSIPQEHAETLRAHCLDRQQATAAQQEILSYMLDLLGYIPTVPPD